MHGIIKRLNANGVDFMIFEPVMKEPEFFRSRVVNDLDAFKHEADVIIANRKTPALSDMEDKVYTCDLFGND